MNNLIKALML
jgi:malate dehydrogenase (oxaloacetate-decarboxylating)(NADP+)